MRGEFGTGSKFGRLTAVAFSHRSRREAYWLFRCECGKEKVVKVSHVVRGVVASCGCYRRERIIGSRTKHGAAKVGKVTSEYRIWSSMKKRCYDANHDAFKYYGGRGVTVCEDWKNSFERFLEDVGPRPSSKHSIDRFPDKNGNYEPENVRWATMAEQNRNKSNTQFVEFGGRVQCLTDWATEIGITEGALRKRIDRWGVEKAITSPIQKNKRTRCAA